MESIYKVETLMMNQNKWTLTNNTNTNNNEERKTILFFFFIKSTENLETFI